MIFFSHIPKAGGSTLDMILYHYLGNDKCIRVWDPLHGADYSAHEFVNLTTECFQGKNLVLGHLDKKTALRNDFFQHHNSNKKLLTVTSVRDPIDRIISLYNYVRVIENHKQGEGLVGSIDELCKFCLEQPQNLQFNYLKEKDTDTVNDVFNYTVIFDIYKSVLGFSTALSQKLNKDNVDFRIENATSKLSNKSKLYTKDDLPDKVILSLENRHCVDYELYNRALVSYNDNLDKFYNSLSNAI